MSVEYVYSLFCMCVQCLHTYIPTVRPDSPFMCTCDFPVIELLFIYLVERQHLMIPSNMEFLI